MTSAKNFRGSNDGSIHIDPVKRRVGHLESQECPVARPGLSQTTGIISLLVAMPRALLSGREQIHERSIETRLLTIMGRWRRFTMDDRQIGESWRPRECWIQDGLEALRSSLI